jgi:cysteine-rich repeat protein
MTTTMHRLLAALPLLLAVAAPLPSRASDVTTNQISNNAVEDGKPRVAGNRVVWQRNPDATGEIVTWTQGGTTQDVTNNAFRDFDPELSGVFAIWKRSTDGNTCSLQSWDFDSAPEQLVSAFTCSDAISVAGPHIGWVDDGSGFFDDVFVSTDREDPEQLGLESVDDGFIRVGNVSGNPRAVWIDEEDVVYWNGSVETALREEPGSDTLRRQLRIDGQRAVWVDEVGGDLEIFLSNGTTVQQLTNNAYDDETPAIRGNDVVWVGFPDSDAEGEIFRYDGTTTEPLTDDDLDDFDPRVSTGPDGTTIAWVKEDGDNEIWMFDGCESTQITDNSVDDDDPSLDGIRVAWVRGSGNSAEVITARVECDVVCGDGTTSGDEECDDDNTVSGDGCSAICQIEECGNSRVDAGEECDDGNTVALDGCDVECLFECGNGALDGDEECDDGDRDGGDGCDEQCFDEICGNGRLQLAAGEECDDGNTVSDDGCSSTCDNEPPAPVAMQRCIAKMNERGAAVVKAQHAVNLLCLSNAAKGTLPALGVPTAQQCLTLDPTAKVAKAQDKTLSVNAAKCTALVPNFAYTSAATVNATGSAEPVTLVANLFGADLDAAVILKATDKAGARCQKNVLTATQQLADRIFKLAYQEKKLLLAGKDDGTLARSNAVLEMRLSEFLLADAQGRIAAKEAAVRTAVRNSCTVPMLDAAFPGCAPSASLNELASCAIDDARCRFCTAFNAFDGLAIDCDAFDDDLANGSCP